MSLPPGVERDYPLARLDHGSRRGRRGAVRAAGVRARADRGARLGGRRGARGRGGRLGLEPAGRRRRAFRGLVLKLAGELAEIERDGHHLVLGAAPACRRPRPRPPAGAGRPSSSGSTSPAPSGAPCDERQRLRRRAGTGARVGGRLHRRRRRAQGPGGAGSPTAASSNLRLARSSRVPASLSEAEPAAVKAILAEMRRSAEAQPSGIKTFGSTFKNPDDARGGAHGGPAPRGRLPGAGGRGRQVLTPSTRTSSITGTATTADVLRVMAQAAGACTSASASSSSRRFRCSASRSIGRRGWTL